jgi:ATP-dependent RNA helicase DOB1
VTSDVWCFLEYKEKLEELQNIQIDCEGQIASYYNIRQQLDKLGVQFRNYITKPNYLIPFLQPGRLVKVSPQFLQDHRK